MTAVSASVICKACGFQIETHQHCLTKYPNGQSVSNPLGLEQIVTCSNCDFGQTRPDPSQADLDTYYASGQYWDEYKENKLLEAHQKVQAEIRLSTVRRFLPPGRDVRVLDIGAGLGFLGDELSEWAVRTKGAGVYYCAVEPDVPTATRASERLNTQERRCEVVKCQVVKSLVEAGGDFDVIFLNHVLEHVHDPIAFLKDVKSRLSKSGTLYVEVPHRDDRFKIDVFPHVLFFSATALRRVAERSGLSVQFCEAFGTGERMGDGMLRVRRAILGRIFNFAARRNWPHLFVWADHRLYRYKLNPSGMWLRAALKRA